MFNVQIFEVKNIIKLTKDERDSFLQRI